MNPGGSDMLSSVTGFASSMTRVSQLVASFGGRGRRKAAQINETQRLARGLLPFGRMTLGLIVVVLLGSTGCPWPVPLNVSE